MTLVAITGESLGYGERTVLSAVRFALRPGERVVLLGRSGAGKSTLIAEIHRRLAASGTRIALIPQEHGLVPQLSVHHNVHLGRLEDHGALYNLASLIRPFARERAAVEDVLREVGLAGEARRAVETLSGGQKQRTALARAFHRGGAVLIGDEPLSAVDERQARALLGAIEARFATSVIALHDVDLAFSHATRLVGVAGGCIVFDGRPQAIGREAVDALYRP